MKRIKFRKLSRVQNLSLGFFIIILIGAGLLMTPLSSADGTFTSPLDALFTAVSSTCVTGLITVDTSIHWSVFGQIVIITLIQIGGLGFMTIGVGIAILLRRRIGLKTRGLIQESVNTLQIGGVIKLAKKIIKGTVLIEGIGAVILSIRFSMDFGIIKGIYYGIFHSISAFCNAGFDLMGQSSGAFASLVDYECDYVVSITICALIILGGIGFIVWDDVTTHKWHFKRYMLHTKIVIVTTAFLLIGGTLMYYILEGDNTLAGLTIGQKLNASLFASSTARTAGFNTSDVASYRGVTKLFTIILMFIGGSPGSTAGGIKTTTVFVLVMYLISTLRSKNECEVFDRRIALETVNKACLVFIINLSLAIIAIMVIASTQNLNIMDVMFEVGSAIATVGITTGITRDLTVLSQIVIIILMFCGRIGSLSFALSFTDSKKKNCVSLPVERINVG